MTVAARALTETTAKLESERQALARLEARHRGRAEALGQVAIDESNRALALGEAARDIVDRMAERGEAQATAGELLALPGPVPRPLGAGVMGPVIPSDTYRLPVKGRVTGGFGEISDRACGRAASLCRPSLMRRSSPPQAARSAMRARSGAMAGSSS
ncbi:hypothetical protein GCM10020258_08850 [Sphingomonas yabuuchiae]